MEEAADRIVSYLYDNFVDTGTGEKNCVLVRFFKTHPYNELDTELQEFAGEIMDGPPDSPEMKCLVLLASTGEKPEWQSRKNSRGHKAIPLPNVHFIETFPMFGQLIHQMGLEMKTVLRPDLSVLQDMAKTTYSVFSIPDAVGSQYAPVQEDFILPYGIRSIIGFGGILPSGNLFVIIIFSRETVSRQIADLFSSLALSVKIAILPFDGRIIFR